MDSRAVRFGLQWLPPFKCKHPSIIYSFVVKVRNDIMIGQFRFSTDTLRTLNTWTALYFFDQNHDHHASNAAVDDIGIARINTARASGRSPGGTSTSHHGFGGITVEIGKFWSEFANGLQPESFAARIQAHKAGD
jgi:hypothetical protein